jgi:hypothetical protein
VPNQLKGAELDRGYFGPFLIVLPCKADLNFDHGDWRGTDAIPSPEEELEAARAAIERAPSHLARKQGNARSPGKSDSAGLTQEMHKYFRAN